MLECTYIKYKHCKASLAQEGILPWDPVCSRAVSGDWCCKLWPFVPPARTPHDLAGSRWAARADKPESDTAPAICRESKMIKSWTLHMAAVFWLRNTGHNYAVLLGRAVIRTLHWDSIYCIDAGWIRFISVPHLPSVAQRAGGGAWRLWSRTGGSTPLHHCQTPAAHTRERFNITCQPLAQWANIVPQEPYYFQAFWYTAKRPYNLKLIKIVQLLPQNTLATLYYVTKILTGISVYQAYWSKINPDLFRLFWFLLLFRLLLLPLLLLVLTLALTLSLVLGAAALWGTDRTPGGPLWRLEVDARISGPIRVLAWWVTVGCNKWEGEKKKKRKKTDILISGLWTWV